MLRAAFAVLFLIVSGVNSEYFEECSGIAHNTYISLADDCHSYIYCSNNVEESLKDECPEGTYFDSNLAECAIDEENICPNKDNEIIENTQEIENDINTQSIENITPSIVLSSSTVLQSSTTVSTISTTKHEFVGSVDATTARPACDRNVDTYHSHNERCEYYYKCVSGFLTILRCNFSYAWDYQRQMCMPKQEVKCYGKSKVRS